MRRMHSRQKYLLILGGIIIAVILLLKNTKNCNIPVSIMQLYRSPLRPRKTSCPAEKQVKSTHLSRVPDIVKTLPRYVSHTHENGRIGNLLFQTASTFGIASTMNYQTYIDADHPLLPYLELTPSTRMDMTNTLVLGEQECMDSVWRCREEIYSHNITLNGFLQSWKYFQHIAPTIREKFTFQPFYRNLAKTFLDSIGSKSRTLIGIHVRRGDFTQHYYSRCGYTYANASYFQRAMELYRKDFKNALFVVISDDMRWCKENIAASDVIYSLFSDPITDLALMSMCDHVIMTGGTFGWWGSWLAGGKVIYLKDWPMPGSWLDLYGMVKEDFFLPGWIGL